MGPLAWFVLFAFVASSCGQQPEVTTSLGTLTGATQETVSGRKFHAFQSVPFAKPPVGKHRFKQSVPAGPWAGVLNATRVPNMCMQLAHPFILADGKYPFKVLGSEDCLYLNIYTPKLPSELPSGKLLDVIFYIHGGGFQLAAGNVWGPLYLMDKDVILVTLNYRLGILGFLSFEDDVVPGNNGLKDQTLALQWVNKHIAAFGGDPKKVTIAGMSAGGASVDYHLISPLSKGLFQKAIANSGSTLDSWALSQTARENALKLVQDVGCPATDTLTALRCLRERPAEELVEAVEGLSLISSEMIPLPFAPVVEPPSGNAFIDQHPVDIIKSNGGSDVPTLFSYSNDEGSMFALGPILKPELNQLVENRWDEMIPILLEFKNLVEPTKAKEIAQSLRKHFMGDKPLKENVSEFSRLFGERFFVDGIQKSAALRAEHQTSPVYAYRFSFKGPKGYNVMTNSIVDSTGYEGGAPHGDDNSYLFDSPFLAPINNFTEAVHMKDYMIDIWMKFIKENPVATWPSVKSGLPNYTFLDIVGSDASKNVFKTEKTVGESFWDSLNIPIKPLSSTKSSQTHNEL